MENYANLVALQVIHSARHDGYLDENGPITVLQALADSERDLFIGILRQLRIHLNSEGRTELNGDEMISIYTFIFAKAVEAVSLIEGNRRFEPELLGMLDGKIPFYTDPRLESFCHMTTFSTDFATSFQHFYAHYGEALVREGAEPMLILAESLKWTWRVAIHVCHGILTEK